MYATGAHGLGLGVFLPKGFLPGLIHIFFSFLLL
jgi:hypothetical protein